MRNLITVILVGWVLHIQLPRILSSGVLGEAPTNTLARCYRAVACGGFLLFAALILAASLVDVCAKARGVSEIIGFSGLACFVASVFCVHRYGSVNKLKKNDDWTEL